MLRYRFWGCVIPAVGLQPQVQRAAQFRTETFHSRGGQLGYFIPDIPFQRVSGGTSRSVAPDAYLPRLL